MSFRVMTMHKTNARDEAFTPPTPELMEKMGKLVGDVIDAGIFLAGDGLLPSSTGVRVKFRNGERTVQRGPFSGGNNLIDRYLVVNTRTIDEAVDWAARFVGPDDAEVDIRPFTEEWDLGVGTKPATLLTTRYMIARKADARSEAGERESAHVPGVLGDMTRAGVLAATERITPSSKAKRVFYRGGTRTIIDGPFTESKELIGGFLMMRVDSIDDVWPWLDRFADAFGDVEIDVRPVYD